jgi:hypothetical protein
MAINKIVAPLATAPNVFAAPVINHLNAHAINVNPIIKIANGYVKKGAMFCIGGELFAADADTAILGSNAGAIAVRFDVSGTTATATYVNDDTGVTWNGAYHGWYDTSDRYYELLWRDTGNVNTLLEIPNGTIVQANGTAWWFVEASGRLRINGMAKIYALVYSRPNVVGAVSYKIEARLNGVLVYENNSGVVTGDTSIFINYGDSIAFKITNNSASETLFVSSCKISSADPDSLRL